MEVKEKSKKRELIKTIAIIFLAVLLIATIRRKQAYTYYIIQFGQVQKTFAVLGKTYTLETAFWNGQDLF